MIKLFLFSSFILSTLNLISDNILNISYSDGKLLKIFKDFDKENCYIFQRFYNQYIDKEFGIDGILEIAFDVEIDILAAAIQEDEKILCIAKYQNYSFAMFRLHSNGTQDTSLKFTEKNLTLDEPIFFNSLNIINDQITICLETKSEHIFFKYNLDGLPYANFGDNGVLRKKKLSYSNARNLIS